MGQGESFVVDIKEHPIAALILIRTFEDNYMVEFDYMGQTIILSQEFKDESSNNNIKLVAIKKAEEFIKSLDEQQDTEAGEAEINAICKAVAELCIDSKFPEWIKWIAIDSDGKTWGFDKKPKINKILKEWWLVVNSNNLPLFLGRISSMEGIDWRKSCVSVNKFLQQIKHNEECVSECEPSYVKERETIETLTERVNKQEEVIIGLLRFMHDKKFLFDKVSDTRSCGALFKECDEYLKKLDATPYEYQKKKIVN